MDEDAKAAYVTTEEYDAAHAAELGPMPGLIVLCGPGDVVGAVLTIPDHGLELGRGASWALHADAWLSRRHARVCNGPRAGSGRVVFDLDSRNGTYVDGERVHGVLHAASPRILRVGQTVLAFCDDVRRLDTPVGRCGDQVVGPALDRARRAIEAAALAGDHVLVSGEGGTGKELAARLFHQAGPRRQAPFVAVTSAAATGGHLPAPDGGTLFVDEIADLPLAAQATLLRVLDRGVDVVLCAATRKDLAREVAAGRFRDDLYRRIARPEIRLPPLRERLEEIPHHVEAELGRPGVRVKPHPSLLEAIALRPWPGNVRELRHELRRLAGVTVAADRNEATVADLAADAGQPLAPRAAGRRAHIRRIFM